MNRLTSPLIPVIALLLATACSRSPQYYLEKGNSLAAAGKYEDATINYRKVIISDARNGEAWHQLGLTLLHLHRANEAWQALSKAVELLPDRDDIAVQLADLTLSAWLIDKRHPKALYDKAADLANRLLAKDALSYDGLRLKAHLAASAKNLKDAEEFFAAANRTRPLQPQTVLGWAEVLFQEGKAAEAESLASQLIAKNKTYGPIYDLLYAYYSQANRPADAEKILQTKVSNNPGDANSHFLLAAFYARTNRPADMEGVLQRMLDNHAAFPAARLQVGDFYRGIRRWDSALHLYEEGAAGNPKERVAYLKRIVDVWIAQGKNAEAQKVNDQVLIQQPADRDAQRIQANLLLATGKPEDVSKAVVLLKTLVEKNPDDSVLRFDLGRGLGAKGDTDAARIQFLEAVKRQASFLPPRIALAELSRAKGDYQATLQYSNEILAINPGLMQIRLVRAIALMNTGRNSDARSELKNIEKAIPANREVRLQLAMLDLRDQKLADAEKGFRQLAGDNASDARAISGLVETLAAENQIDRAFPLLQDQLKNFPDSLPLRSVLAATAIKAGKYDLALEQYQRILAAGPPSEQLCLALGTAYRLKKDYPAAAPWFQKAQSLAPNDPEPLMQLGGDLALSGRNPEALANYRKALKLKPDDAAASSNTAYLIAEVGGNLDEALTLAQKAVRLDPKQPHYADTLGWVFFKKGMNTSAVQVFRDLTEKYPENETYRHHFAMVQGSH